MHNLAIVSGIADNIFIDNGKLSMTVTHTGPQGTDPNKPPRQSVFEIEANNGTAEWAAELPLANGTTVTIFGYRLEPKTEVFDGKTSVWLKIYARDIIIRDPDSREVTTGILVGRVGQDAEMKYLPSSQSVTSASVAIDFGVWNPTTNKWDNTTTWCKCTVWGNKEDSDRPIDPALNAATKLLKGTLVEVPFHDLHTSAWIDKEGALRLSVDVTASGVSVLKEPSASSTPLPANPPMRNMAAMAAAAAAAAAAATQAPAPTAPAPEAPAATQPATLPPAGRPF